MIRWNFNSFNLWNNRCKHYSIFMKEPGNSCVACTIKFDMRSEAQFIIKTMQNCVKSQILDYNNRSVEYNEDITWLPCRTLVCLTKLWEIHWNLHYTGKHQQITSLVHTEISINISDSKCKFHTSVSIKIPTHQWIIFCAIHVNIFKNF